MLLIQPLLPNHPLDVLSTRAIKSLTENNKNLNSCHYQYFSKHWAIKISLFALIDFLVSSSQSEFLFGSSFCQIHRSHFFVPSNSQRISVRSVKIKLYMIVFLLKIQSQFMARATAELLNGDFAVTRAIMILLGWAATKKPKPVLLQLRKFSEVG